MDQNVYCRGRGTGADTPKQGGGSTEQWNGWRCRREKDRSKVRADNEEINPSSRTYNQDRNSLTLREGLLVRLSMLSIVSNSWMQVVKCNVAVTSRRRKRISVNLEMSLFWNEIMLTSWQEP
jgi:hypothetical protein